MFRDWRTEYEEELAKLTPEDSEAFNEYRHEQRKSTCTKDPDSDSIDQGITEGQEMLRSLLFQDRQLPPVEVTSENVEMIKSIRRDGSVLREATIQLMYFHLFQVLEQFKKDQNNNN